MMDIISQLAGMLGKAGSVVGDKLGLDGQVQQGAQSLPQGGPGIAGMPTTSGPSATAGVLPGGEPSWQAPMLRAMQGAQAGGAMDAQAKQQSQQASPQWAPMMAAPQAQQPMQRPAITYADIMARLGKGR